MKGNVYWPLLVFYCAIEGWVLAFPLFGPALGSFATAYGANPALLSTSFLFSFSASFAVWGIILRNQSKHLGKLRVLVIAAILACIVLSLSLLIIPSRLWSIVFVGFGIAASLPSLVWLTFVSQGLDRKKIGWNLGITGVFVELINYATGVIGQYFEEYMLFLSILVLPVIAILVLLAFPSIFTSEMSINDVSQKRAPVRWTLYLFIFSFPLVGGIMYNVVHPLFLASYPRLLDDYGTLPYILTMPFAGYLADKRSIRPVALYGLASLGVSYTLFVLSTSLWSAVTGDTFLNIGFGFMDLFVLFVLAWYAPQKRAPLYIGGGLAVYIFSILAGIWLTELIVPHTKGNYNTVYLIAILIMFGAFLLLEWIVKRTDEADRPYEAIGEDLELARNVQINMLPKHTDFPAGWDIAYTFEVAREVGGDFFDVISFSEYRVLFVIGDVMGKGLSAAMLVSSVLGQIRSLAESTESLSMLLTRINQVLIRDVRFSMYVTVGLVLIDRQQAILTYASAGHMPPYILDGGIVRSLDVSFLPLGTDIEAVYDETVTEFMPGDVLVLYTDGVVETKNKRKELYGFDRFETEMGLCQGLSADEINRRLAVDLREFSGQASVEDDFTLLVVKW